MKKLIFGLIATVVFSSIGNAQSVSKTIDIKNLGKNSTIMFKNSFNSDCFALKVINDEKTVFEPVFNCSNYSDLRVELYNEVGKLITSYIDNAGETRGPNNNSVLFFDPNEPFKTINYNKEEIWPLIIAAILYCGNASVGSGGWSIGWDCNGNRAGTTVDLTIKDKLFKVSKINFVPLDKYGKTLPVKDYSKWSISVN